MADSVLPPLTPIPGLEHIKHPDDLLTDDERKKLYDELAEMARRRRRAEAEAAWLPMA